VCGAVGYLPQNITLQRERRVDDMLGIAEVRVALSAIESGDTLTVAGNVARFAPHASPNAVRAKLARMLFPGRRADQPVSTLSGGELFRATLAALLLAEIDPL
jgi:ATPase subunit of ABC transporter with duplicated ATPase domains